VRLQAQAVAYFVPSRPAAELCGAAFARHVGRAYDTVQNAVSNINVLKRAALRDKALDALQSLASGAQYVDEVSARHVAIAIGIRPDLVKYLIRPELDSTRASLQVRRKGSTFLPAATIPTVDAPLMQEPFFFEGGVVDLATDTWDFLQYPKVRRVVSKTSMRPDLADIAWVVLRQTLRTARREISTVKSLWWGFVHAGSVLDGFVDDLHRAELPAVQAAWYTALKRDTRPKLAITRTALCRWLEEVLAKPLEPADAQRLARILGWLREMPLPKRSDAETALSTDAFARLLRTCAEAIVAGRRRDWPLDASRMSRSECWVFNRWSIALMTLVSGTTGLRRQSLELIEVDDWGEVQPGHFWLCWKHDKKHEEHDAVLERGVALLLDEYRERTAAQREAIGTRRLFLRFDLERGTWAIADAEWIWQGLRLLGDRAVLALPEGSVGLTTRLLRRTVATRQVQAGAHIEAIAAQLGHSTTLTTMQYVRYDRMTHATEIREALDAGAKLALFPWDQGPRLLADLAADERARFLGALPEHDVGVGLCDEATCVMVERGSAVPPCFRCTHLLTGPEFLLELEDLQRATQAETRGIPATPSYSALQANKRYELECLDRLIDSIRSREDLLGGSGAP
jgi:integrase